MEKFFNKKTMPYWLLLPTFLYFTAFWLFPVIKCAMMSFQTPEGAITIQNYISVFNDPEFPVSFWNTVIIVIVSVTIEFVLALFLALIVNMKFKGVGVLLFLAMIPMALPAAALGAIWKTGFTDYGWINSILYHLNIITSEFPISWLSGDRYSLLGLIILVDAWNTIPTIMIILLAGLQGLSDETKEAGYTFGATKLTVLRKITVPMLKPTIVTAVILRLISAIQIWMIIVMLVNFGRLPVLLSRIVYYSEKVIGLKNHQQMAATYSIVVSLIVTVAAIIYLRASGAIGKKKGGAA
jgi:multiple sugar transport system permease protein